MPRAALARSLALAALLPLSGCVGFFRWVDQVLLPEETTDDEPPREGPERDPRADPDSGGGDSGWWDDRG